MFFYTITKKKYINILNKNRLSGDFSKVSKPHLDWLKTINKTISKIAAWLKLSSL